MISKRILLATVCLAVLIIAVGAYGYALYSEISSLKRQISLINQELEELWEEINTLKPSNSTNETMNFTFTWGSEAQDIVDGPFKIEVSVWFENHTSPWDNATYEMFHIVVRVYDDDYCSDDYLGLVFDMNHNGVIDLGFEDRPRLLYANNSTIGYAALTKEGFLAPAEVPREKIYTCTYDPERGYAFGPFGYQASDITSKFGDMPTYVPVHMCFVDRNLYPGIHGVSVQFRIYLDS